MLIRRVNKKIKKTLRTLFEDAQWPCPRVNIKDEPHFLFIITPPYSGSTALAKILNSSHSSTFLQKRAEGQWLIPGMCAKDRWDPAKVMNWKSIRSVWLHRVQEIQSLVQNVDLVIEKSPGSLVRINQLIDVFPNHSLMAFNRNPFANCSSILYRTKQNNKSDEERIRALKKIAAKWLNRSRWIRKWIEEKNIVNFTYENFCAAPAECILPLIKIIPALQFVDVSKEIKVKDYKKQRLINQNAIQIERLTQKEIGAISEVLCTDPELVMFFGYDTEKAE